MPTDNFHSAVRLNFEEAAARANMSADYIERRIRYGNGPAFFTYRGVRWIALEELKRWLASMGREMIDPRDYIPRPKKGFRHE